MSSGANYASWMRRGGVIASIAAAALAGCAVPQRAPAPLLYDFGIRAPAAPAPAVAVRPSLAITAQATAALDGHAMLYRLAYADGQQLHAYSQARWAMSPAELVQQRLREGLSARYTVVHAGQGAPRVLQFELEEFSQVFESPAVSRGELRLRATLWQRQAGEERMLVQRSVVVQRPAPTADAAGGVRALGAATDAAVDELVQWLQQLPLR